MDTLSRPRLVYFVFVACLLIGCSRPTPSHISADEFKAKYRLGRNQTMEDVTYLGQGEGRAYLRIQTMSTINSKKWDERIVCVELAELDEEFRNSLPKMEAQDK